MVHNLDSFKVQNRNKVRRKFRHRQGKEVVLFVSFPTYRTDKTEKKEKECNLFLVADQSYLIGFVGENP